MLGLAWEHLDLTSGLLTIRRNLVRQNGKTITKDTKTHQMRIVSLDPDTITIRRDHKQRVEQQCEAIGTTLTDDALPLAGAVQGAAIRSSKHGWQSCSPDRRRTRVSIVGSPQPAQTTEVNTRASGGSDTSTSRTS